ncbi:hypothetical protein N9L68_01795 [bacterium]|nr:hypothetical protein [bacterium]
MAADSSGVRAARARFEPAAAALSNSAARSARSARRRPSNSARNRGGSWSSTVWEGVSFRCERAKGQLATRYWAREKSDEATTRARWPIARRCDLSSLGFVRWLSLMAARAASLMISVCSRRR